MDSQESQWSRLYDVVGVVLQSVRPAEGLNAAVQPDPAE